MKKSLLFVLMIMLSATIIAQNTRKVAILETVDKENKVSYGIKLQLRSSLTYAISSTPGYEGYDRVDMSSIMGEHNFQRTGYVSDAQIKKLGEMTGASSILVAEAAVYDASHIIVTAKILNVETASVENSAPPQIAGTDPEAMRNACKQLAEKLFGNVNNEVVVDFDQTIVDCYGRITIKYKRAYFTRVDGELHCDSIVDIK